MNLKRKIYTIIILCLLLNSGIILVLASNHDNKDYNDEQGIFNAELGRRGNEESFVILDGQYRVRERGIVFSGKAIAEEREGRFYGGFRGNHFIIRLPIMRRTITLLGRFNQFDDNYFEGLWIIRGYRLSGWISGILTPSI